MAAKYLILFIIALSIAPAFAQSSRADNICWANPDATLCGCTTKPFSCVIAPFEAIAPGYGLLFIWAPIILGIWFKTGTPIIAAIVGLIVIATFGTGIVIGDDTLTLHPQAVGIGLVLVAVAGGIGLIQIFQRIKQTV